MTDKEIEEKLLSLRKENQKKNIDTELQNKIDSIQEKVNLNEKWLAGEWGNE